MAEYEVNSFADLFRSVLDGSDRKTVLENELKGILNLLSKNEIDIERAEDFKAILLEYIDLPETARTERKSVRDFKHWLQERGVVLEL